MLGLVVFSILGYMAHVTNQDVSEIVAPGSGLAFIVYPEVVSRYMVRSLKVGTKATKSKKICRIFFLNPP